MDINDLSGVEKYVKENINTNIFFPVQEAMALPNRMIS